MSNTRPALDRTVLAPKGRTLKLTPDIIAAGIPKNSGHCMIAEAIKKQIPQARHVAVDIQTIRYTDVKLKARYIYLTPPSVQRHIILFDQGKKPHPLDFRLNGGQIIPMAPKKTKRKSRRKPRRVARLVNVNRSATQRLVPKIVGGKAPPRAIGHRREFGLRSMGR